MSRQTDLFRVGRYDLSKAIFNREVVIELERICIKYHMKNGSSKLNIFFIKLLSFDSRDCHFGIVSKLLVNAI
jgi:hypothetical protein